MFAFNALGLFRAVRSFSTSAVSEFPKLKSHSGAKKRWRAIANGHFKRAQAGHSHLNVTKRPGRKNCLGRTAYSNSTQKAILKKALPYGN
ncbi:ribosomal protein L35 [Phellopilus nigrolimitatus]|nr:ribosomal protein L35 [Phellopilus nigrolimitatus]